MLWGNIGAADRLDFTAIGPAVNLVSRLEGLCRPLGKAVLVSGAFAAETGNAADPARNACAARHRVALRGLHRAGDLSDQDAFGDKRRAALAHHDAVDVKGQQFRASSTSGRRLSSSAAASAGTLFRICPIIMEAAVASSRAREGLAERRWRRSGRAPRRQEVCGARQCRRSRWKGPPQPPRGPNVGRLWSTEGQRESAAGVQPRARSSIRANDAAARSAKRSNKASASACLEGKNW